MKRKNPIVRVSFGPVPVNPRPGFFKCHHCGKTKPDAHRKNGLPDCQPCCLTCYPVTMTFDKFRDVRGATIATFTAEAPDDA